MVEASDKKFEEMVSEGIDAVPPLYQKHLQNVAFIVEDNPSKEQMLKLGLRSGDLLFGLYEGLPLPQRSGAAKLLPDKITIFKNPLQLVSADLDDLRDRVARTIWHEVAHYYGLDHSRIHALERKEPK